MGDNATRVPWDGPPAFLAAKFFLQATHAAGRSGAILGVNMSDSDQPKNAATNANTKDTVPCSVTCNSWVAEAEAFALREPGKAVISAVGAGLLLHLLPVRAICGALAAVAVAAARPALIFLGMMKLSELCPCKKESKS